MLILYGFQECKLITIFCLTLSYRKRNDEKTPGKLSDTNDDTDSSIRIKKCRTKKACWSSDSQQENEQQNQDNNINRQHRRSKGSIAKSLHYGMESTSDETHSIPLYRLVLLKLSNVFLGLHLTYICFVTGNFAKL
jgi:hypothetical protein